MNIEAINEWFYDDITARGVSFDGFLPQACKTPLGDMKDFELIHTPKKMASFQTDEWYQKNWNLADTLLTASPLESDKHVLFNAYRQEMAAILSTACDSELCEHKASSISCPTRGSCRGLRTLREDLSRYGEVMTGNNDLDDGKIYDVKKEIYRLTDRVFAALAKSYEVDASGAFAILDEMCKRGIISTEARDNLASASAIAIKLRLSTYLKAGKQGEQLMASSSEGKSTSVYYMPNEEEIFHFFYIAIPLYEVLQPLRETENILPTLKHYSFYDDSDATKGHVFSRLLNYGKALECYERALRKDPKRLSIQIRRIRIELFVKKTPETIEEIQERVDDLLSKIDKGLFQSHHKDSKTAQEDIEFAHILDIEECRQLLEVLLFASSFYKHPKYFAWAEKLLAQCLAVEKSKHYARKESLMMKFAYMNFYQEHFSKVFVQRHQIDGVISELSSLIDEEGVSTKSIVWLNRLGEFLYLFGKSDKSYRCFQRALSMENLLYGTNPNMNMMTSLKFLGRISMSLFMYPESKFYFEKLVQLFRSFGGPGVQLVLKSAYLQLALLSFTMDCGVEKITFHLEEGLKVITGSINDEELSLDCVIHFQLATTWHAQQNSQQAWRSAMNGQACLKNIAGTHARVTMTCLLAVTLAKIEKINEGIIVLKEELSKLNSHFQMEERADCMRTLANLCADNGLTTDAENYYKQALGVLVDLRSDQHILEILECLIGISRIIMEHDSRMSEAAVLLCDAFDFVKKMNASQQKCSMFKEIGELHERLCDVNSARLCFEEALRAFKEESNIAKKLPFLEIQLEIKLGEMASKACAAGPKISQNGIPLEQRMQAERVHYDRAVEVLRQHVATGHVDSTTVILFLSLALKFTRVDLNVKVKLLLETLKISETVYGANKANEVVAKILGQISDTYWKRGNMKAATKYRELLLRTEMDLHQVNPLHEHIFHNLTSLSFCFLKTPGNNDTVERAYRLLLSAQEDNGLTTNTSKAAAARCFTSLGVLFYALNDLEKAETLTKMASQLFTEVQKSVENEKLISKTTCDVMKKILLHLQVFPLVLPAHENELEASILKVFVSDNTTVDQFISRLLCGSSDATTLQNISGTAASFKSLDVGKNSSSDCKNAENYHCSDPKEKNATKMNSPDLNNKDELKHDSTSFRDDSVIRDELSDPEDKKATKKDSIGSTDKDSVKGDSSDPQVEESIAQRLSQIRFPIKLESFPNALKKPETIKSTISYLKKTQEEMLPKVSVLTNLVDAMEYNEKTGNVEQVAKIGLEVLPQLLPLVQSNPCDIGEKLIRDAIEAKQNNKVSCAIRHLDLASQLPSEWTRKVNVLRLRGECYLSTGDNRTAAINFTKALDLYSSDRLENSSDLSEYSDVLIGLIKSEILCQNVASAWLRCQEGMELVLNDERKETVHYQAAQFFYLGAKCLVILSAGGKGDDEKLAKACSFCGQTLNLSYSLDQTKEVGDVIVKLGRGERGGELFALKCEVQLLFATVLRKLQKDEEADDILKEIEKFLLNIAVVFESISPSSNAESKSAFVNISRRLFSWVGRALLMRADMSSIIWLEKALSALFSSPLTDILFCFEEVLPLLDALTVFKSRATEEDRSPFQQAVDACKEASSRNGNLNNFYDFLKSLFLVYVNLERTEEAIVLAETGLNISDFMCGNSSDQKRSRGRMLLYLAQIHQLRSTNSSFDRNRELILVEEYYRIDRGSTHDFALRKDLSYANFLCEQKRYDEAGAVLLDINHSCQKLWGEYVFCSYSLRQCNGAGVQKSVEIDGELIATAGDVMYGTMVRVFVAMGKKKDAVAACEKLTTNSKPVHGLLGERPPCLPYLIEACQRELLSLLSSDDRTKFQNCDFPLCPKNVAKLYYMLDEYILALKYWPTGVESAELIEMKMSCFRLAGNDLVKKDKGGDSPFYFKQFLEMLHTKDDFLDKPFHIQCETLEGYSIADLYYVFRTLGIMLCQRENVEGAIQCYERCIELDAEFSYDQNLVATLADLYQSKALTVDIKNQDLAKKLMNLALCLFQKLLERTSEITAFVESSFASLLFKLERYGEAISHFENVIKRAGDGIICFGKVDKPLLDVFRRRELEVRGQITLPVSLCALYELILIYAKIREVEKAEECAIELENYIARLQSSPMYPLALSLAGYAYKLIGNNEKAAELFVAVLDIIPGHLPVAEALESCCM